MIGYRILQVNDLQRSLPTLQVSSVRYSHQVYVTPLKYQYIKYQVLYTFLPSSTVLGVRCSSPIHTYEFFHHSHRSQDTQHGFGLFFFLVRDRIVSCSRRHLFKFCPPFIARQENCLLFKTSSFLLPVHRASRKLSSIPRTVPSTSKNLNFFAFNFFSCRQRKSIRTVHYRFSTTTSVFDTNTKLHTKQYVRGHYFDVFKSSVSFNLFPLNYILIGLCTKF